MEGLVMKYFVLKPKGDDMYALASRIAIREYAKIIALENHELSEELLEWANKETINAVEKRKEDYK